MLVCGVLVGLVCVRRGCFGFLGVVGWGGLGLVGFGGQERSWLSGPEALVRL
jgi:hypothetical protein